VIETNCNTKFMQVIHLKWPYCLAIFIL